MTEERTSRIGQADRHRLLFYDNEETWRVGFERACRYLKRRCKVVSSRQEVLEEFQTNSYGAVFLDLDYNAQDIPDTRILVENLKRINPELPVIGFSVMHPKTWSRGDRSYFDQAVEKWNYLTSLTGKDASKKEQGNTPD